MNVWEAIESAERILPGNAAPEGEDDPRWQAIIKIGNFVQSEPDAIWSFIVRWGCSDDEDLRDAVATCLLEHLLEFHFDSVLPRLEEAVQGNALLGDTFARCWKFGQAKEEGNAQRFDKLKANCRRFNRNEGHPET